MIAACNSHVSLLFGPPAVASQCRSRLLKRGDQPSTFNLQPFPLNSPEVFYLHLQGEQRGPYTVQHIDHLLHSRLIAEETLFWREGLEQWQPVTDLVPRRRAQKRSWAKPAIVLGSAVVLAALAHVFGPTAMDGWREADQHDFTPRAAYWRARDAVRQQVKSDGGLAAFAPSEQARMELGAATEAGTGDSARVLLPGEVTAGDGQTRPARWEVRLRYDREKKMWSAASVEETQSNG